MPGLLPNIEIDKSDQKSISTPNISKTNLGIPKRNVKNNYYRLGREPSVDNFIGAARFWQRRRVPPLREAIAPEFAIVGRHASRPTLAKLGVGDEAFRDCAPAHIAFAPKLDGATSAIAESRLATNAAVKHCNRSSRNVEFECQMSEGCLRKWSIRLASARSAFSTGIETAGFDRSTRKSNIWDRMFLDN